MREGGDKGSKGVGEKMGEGNKRGGEDWEGRGRRKKRRKEKRKGGREKMG